MKIWARGLEHASDMLIRRGTAMGPLIPLLFLVPCFLFASWLWREHQITSAAFGVAAAGIVIEYLRQFAKFAKQDPDRLQSEEYRYEMTKIQMIAAKELPYPIPADSILLAPATSNPNHPFSEETTGSRTVGQDRSS